MVSGVGNNSTNGNPTPAAAESTLKKQLHAGIHKPAAAKPDQNVSFHAAASMQSHAAKLRANTARKKTEKEEREIHSEMVPPLERP